MITDLSGCFFKTHDMNAWFQLIADQPQREASPAQNAGGIVAPLTDVGLIAATGDDAARFLHNQVTNDVEHLAPGEARLAGYCSPKGRLLASFLYWKQDDAVLLQLPRTIQPSIQKRLQMFVLRSKAKLTDVTAEHAVLGMAGPAAQQWLQQRFPALPTVPYGAAYGEAGTLIRLPDTHIGPRFQWVTTPDNAVAAWAELSAILTPSNASAWWLMDIRAGIPRIVTATQEQFVPQMVNFELIGGVNFRKGCYPGQEIVARSQYLGKLKRRTVLASVTGVAVFPGNEVFSNSDPMQPCGMIVNAEPNGDGFDCLVELKLSALESGAIHVGASDGPVLDFRPLPYPLTEPA